MTPLLLLALLFQPIRTFTISGVVVDSVTGTPISKARISLSPPAAAPVVTGVDGRFVFTGLNAQKYSMLAQRLGYASQAFGQRALYQQYSSAIVTGENQTNDNLVYRMIPGGVIFGYVRDTSGEPVPGMTIQAVQISGSGIRRRIISVHPGSTDDRGYYRIPSLTAGTYAVVMAGNPSHDLPVPATDLVAYPRTFYPGTTDPSQASQLAVSAGQEVKADLIARPVPAGRILGTAPRIDKTKKIYAVLTAPTLMHGEVLIRPSVWLGNGTFSFENVPEGRYTVHLMGESNHTEGFAQVDVQAGDNSVTVGDVLLPQINIHISLSGQSRFPQSTLITHLIAIDGAGNFSAPVSADGKASIPQVLPGKYELSVTQSRRLAITSIKAQGASAQGDMLDIPESGSASVEVTADASALNLPGVLTRDGKAQPGKLVMLVQRDGWQYTASYRFDQTDTDGTFTWNEVPPGDYLMFAFDEGLPDDYDDPDTIRKFLPMAQPLKVTGNPGQTVQLSLPALPTTNQN